MSHSLFSVRVMGRGDRKSTRLNSSHVKSSYAVFCLKKKILIRHHLAAQHVRVHIEGPGDGMGGVGVELDGSREQRGRQSYSRTDDCREQVLERVGNL